ncbi:hypothetical protein LCGC14_2616830 [marine sediment metagenome]|uniref:Uncharacterized protein n=1 Tax=marine sediment metagenome TaxID=412755 RepID=A0A0F9CFC2_9ZZZZ
MSVAGSSWIGKKIVDGFEHQRKKADGKTETVDLTEGLTDPQQAILGITKVIAITPSGIVFKKASALGIKIILDELPAYFDISMGLKSDLKAIDAADPTKPLKYPNLRNQAWVQRVLGPLPGLKSSVNFDSNLKTLDDELNGAEKKIKELKDDLSKDVSKLNYIDITERIEHIKEHLIKAAKELGLSMAIYDNTNPTINDRVRDFNQIFKEAFELNKKFIDIKQKNPNLVMKSLKVLANGVGIGYNGFFNPYGSGKIYTFALSNMIYFSPHLGFEPPSFNPSEAAKDYIWFNTYFQLGDSAARLAHTVGTYAWNRYWGKKDIFDFPGRVLWCLVYRIALTINVSH